jgi:hypothetical protein
MTLEAPDGATIRARRIELAATRGLLVEFARTLGEVAGAASLLPTDGAPGG